MSRPKTKYYWVEIPADTAAAISSACEMLATLLVGKLDVMEEVIASAIEKRTGEKPSELTMNIVRDSLKNIQYIGWDSTYGNKVNMHKYSPTADTLLDVMEVLNYQMKHDEIVPYFESPDVKYPMHWNDDMPLCRILRTTESVYNRNKQLYVFPFEK